MKKKIISVLLSSVMAMSVLAGCGGSGDAEKEEPKQRIPQRKMAVTREKQNPAVIPWYTGPCGNPQNLRDRLSRKL